MANHQYQIPQSPESQPIQDEKAPQDAPLKEALRLADTLTYTPETQPEAYRVLTDAAERIWLDRDVELAASMQQRKGIASAFGRFVKRDAPSLTDKEGEIGGALYGPGTGRRFWLADRNYDAQAEAGTVAHWFYTEPIPISQNKTTELTLHYEMRPTEIIKWFAGQPREVSVAEIGTLCQIIPRYEDAVRRELYPLSETVHEMEEEILHENDGQDDTRLAA